jgi:primosomal protein N' (replication factor Y) (superfamily II helicase)
MHRALSDGGNVLLYVSKKGLAGSLVCRDCRHTQTCSICESPLKITELKKSDARTIECVYCSTKRDLYPEETLVCMHCKSWNILTRGVTTQTVREELSKYSFPIFQIDSLDTPKVIKQTISEFENTHSSVMIVSDISPSLFSQPVDLVAIVSLDSRLAAQYYSMDYTVARIVLLLLSMTNNTLYLQTRLKNNSFMVKLLEGGVDKIVKSYAQDIQALCYPPMCSLIEIYTNTPLKESTVSLLKKYSTHDVLSRAFKGKSVTLIKCRKESKDIPYILDDILALEKCSVMVRL